MSFYDKITNSGGGVQDYAPDAGVRGRVSTRNGGFLYVIVLAYPIMSKKNTYLVDFVHKNAAAIMSYVGQMQVIDHKDERSYREYLQVYRAQEFPVLEVYELTYNAQIRTDIQPIIIRSNPTDCDPIMQYIENNFNKRLAARQRGELHTREAASSFLRMGDEQQSAFEKPVTSEDMARGRADYKRRLETAREQCSTKAPVGHTKQQVETYGRGLNNELESIRQKVRIRSSEDDDEWSGDFLTKIYERENLVTNMY